MFVRNLLETIIILSQEVLLCRMNAESKCHIFTLSLAFTIL